MDTMVTRILIADDHSVVRQGLRMFLALDPDLEVVAEATDGAEALRLARELQPDVVLMDLLMPAMDGIAATQQIRRGGPGTPARPPTPAPDGVTAVRPVPAGPCRALFKKNEADEPARGDISTAARPALVSP